MKQNKVILAIITVSISGCAATPQDTLGTLAQTDPKYETQACLDARNIAMQYNDRQTGRAATGILLGLAGPVGLLTSVAIDSNQARNRSAVIAEVKRRCETPKTPEQIQADKATSDKKTCVEKDGKMLCAAS